MILRVKKINEIQGFASPYGGITIECVMTEGQMYDALQTFLEHVTDETWERWVKEINDMEKS